MRTFAFGDIHGCITALRAILEHIRPTSQDRLVFLGDYVDRGPDSFAVLETVRELHKRGQAVCVRGNHEEMMLSAQAGGPDLAFWLQVGGAAALESYEKQTGVLQVAPQHLQFVEEGCVDYFEDDTHIFVHASIDPTLPLELQSVATLRWQRFRDPDPHFSGKTLVAGHTSQKNGVPRDIGHAICIDTYCYGGQWLTCLETRTGAMVQANERGDLRALVSRSETNG